MKMKKASVVILSALFAATIVRGSWAVGNVEAGGEGIEKVSLPAMDMGIPQDPAINANALPEGFLNNEGNLEGAVGNETRELPLVRQETAVKAAPGKEVKIGATISRQTRTAALLQKSTRRLSALKAMFMGKAPSQNADAESLALAQSKKFDDSTGKGDVTLTVSNATPSTALKSRRKLAGLSGLLTLVPASLAAAATTPVASHVGHVAAGSITGAVVGAIAGYALGRLFNPPQGGYIDLTGLIWLFFAAVGAVIGAIAGSVLGSLY